MREQTASPESHGLPPFCGLLLPRVLGALLIALVLVSAGFAMPATRQAVPQQSIYPGLESAELREALRQSYSPSQTLGYGAARDVLFEYLNDTRGELRGVYTGYAITLDPGEDPTQDANGPSFRLHTCFSYAALIVEEIGRHFGGRFAIDHPTQLQCQ